MTLEGRVDGFRIRDLDAEAAERGRFAWKRLLFNRAMRAPRERLLVVTTPRGDEDDWYRRMWNAA